MHRELSRDRLYVTVDILILTVRAGQLEILLSRRTAPPFDGQWALPGRFVGTDESAETAVRRLLDEMLPIPDAFTEQLYTFTDKDRDPRGRVISLAYLVIIPWGRLEPLLGKAGSTFRSFRVTMAGQELCLTDGGEDLSPGELAFDHGRIASTGICRLRGKIDYTDIGFRFLEDPAAFSLGDLQTVFEAVLGEKQDSSNFRRGILNRYERTGRLAQTEREERRARGRPAALYRMTF